MRDRRGAAVWLALLALPFHALPGWRLQPSELLALPLLALAAWSVARGARSRWSSVDAGVAAWCAAVLLSVLLQWWLRGLKPNGVVLLELAKKLYLCLLYLAVRVVCPVGVVGQAAAALAAGGALAAALGVLGALASGLGLSSPLALPAETYPYFGDVPRARAFTAAPNMLASIAMLSLLLLAAGAASLPRTLRRSAAVLLALGFAATLSKTAVALALGLLVVWALRRQRVSRRMYAGVGLAAAAAAVVLGVFSHAIVVCDASERARLAHGLFIAGAPLPIGLPAGCAAHATNYAFNKQVSLIAVQRSWPFGIGPGRQPGFALRLQLEGRYPPQLWAAVPHSTYTGVPAELGLAGLVGLGMLAAGLVRGTRDSLRGEAARPLAVASAGALAAIAVEALVTDVMNFRHYAWLAGLLGSAAAAEEPAARVLQSARS